MVTKEQIKEWREIWKNSQHQFYGLPSHAQKILLDEIERLHGILENNGITLDGEKEEQIYD